VCGVCHGRNGMCVSLNGIVGCMCVYAVGGVYVCVYVRVYAVGGVYVCTCVCMCVGGRNLCVYVCTCVMCNAHV